MQLSVAKPLMETIYLQSSHIKLLYIKFVNNNFKYEKGNKLLVIYNSLMIHFYIFKLYLF